MLQQIEPQTPLFINSKGELMEVKPWTSVDRSCSWVARQRVTQQAINIAIAYMIGMQPEEYDRFKINVLLDFVNTAFTDWGYNDPEGLAYSTLTRKEVLGWWRNSWAAIDEFLLLNLKPCKSKDKNKRFILSYHVNRIAPDRPDGQNLRESFLKVIEK